MALPRRDLIKSSLAKFTVIRMRKELLFHPHPLANISPSINLSKPNNGTTTAGKLSVKNYLRCNLPNQEILAKTLNHRQIQYIS